MKRNPSGLRMITRRNKMVIRPANVTDAERVAILSVQLGYPVSTREMAKRIATVVRRKDQKLLVAEVAGKVEGWVEVFRPLSVLNWGKGEVGALVVDTQSRGKGVGKSLLDAARVWFEKHGCHFIYLRSNVKRKRAHEFYRRAGYRVHKTQRVFQLLVHEHKPKD